MASRWRNVELIKVQNESAFQIKGAIKVLCQEYRGITRVNTNLRGTLHFIRKSGIVDF